MIRRSAYVAIALALATACRNHPSKLDTWSAQALTPRDPSAPGPGDADAPPRPEPLTAARLDPRIRELGPDGVVPTSFVIQLATPIVDESDVGKPSARTRLRIVPELPGRLVYSGVSELTFTPLAPLAFDTGYRLELAAVETRDGVIEAPAGPAAAPWSYAFKTPSFAFLGWSQHELDLAHHAITLDVTFSGVTVRNDAARAIAVTIDGKAAPKPTWISGGAPNVIRVRLVDPRIAPGARLGLTLGPLYAATGEALPTASADLVVSAEGSISVLHAEVAEGASGFYVDVICDDAAAKGSKRPYYGPGETFPSLSSRCQLADASHVSFSPAVANVYVTASSAGFRVFGDFKRGVYKMKIAEGATSIDGGVLVSPYSTSFTVSARKPQLSFGSTGRYLPRGAWSNLGIKHLNVDAVNLVIRQVPPENLVYWLGNEGSDAADERTSDVIFKKEIPLRATPEHAATTWLDVGSMLPRTTRGVLELKLAAVGATATSRLLLTNLSLVAKKTAPPDRPWEQRVQVWALDMDSNALLDDAEISLVRKSGKTVARCTTAGSAGCVLQASDDRTDQAEPFALVARRGEDLTYIRYKDLRAEVVESTTSGAPYASAQPYRAAVFAERGVYRPGDTVHVTAIVRDTRDAAPGQPLPVEVKLIDPRAKVARKLVIPTNPAGVVAFEHALPPFADTGHWRVALASGDKPLASYDLQVEEFVPERMQVELAPRQPAALLGGGPLSFDVRARYLFGGSALDSGVELSCAVSPAAFVPERNADLTYGVAPRGKAVTLGQSRTQLDPSGHAAIDCAAADGQTTFTQTGQLTATAAVLEAGSGRATVRTANVLLHPETYYLGARARATRATSGATFQVEGKVVDWRGEPLARATDRVTVELFHLDADYSYGYDEATGESRYDRWLREVPEGRTTAKVDHGAFRFDVTPREAAGGFVVRLSAGKARTDLVLEGDYSYDYYEYGEGSRTDQTPRPARPTQLALELPAEIEVGKRVTVKARAPYRGKVLWTVETDRVIRAEWKDVTGPDATWSFELDAFAPNVYVAAFVVKDPHHESRDAFLPDRAFGVASARVRPTAFTQDVKLDVPATTRSSSKLEVKLDLGRGAASSYAMVAVVDEGILSLTGFASPDPLGALFARRALGVETYETIGWTMLHQPAGASSRIGGGDDSAAAAASPPGGQRVQAVKPVSLFSGVVPVPADGKLVIPFQLPSYRGQLRVMAVTASPTRIGRAEARVTVRDPLVVQVTFPRFVTQNDQLQIPVFLTNMSGRALDVSLALDSSTLAVPGQAQPASAVAPLRFTGKQTGSISLADGRSDTLVFQATAAMPAGGARLRVVARAGALEVSEEVEVPFLSAGPRERVVEKIRLTPGRLDLAAHPALRGWAPDSETTTLWITSNPYGDSLDHLRYLIHYPYGCIEQTTSTTRPLLHIASLVDRATFAQRSIEDMVQSGIDRIFAMETPSGGFGYWPGANEAEDWGSAYATHLLLDARKAGYAVPDDRLQRVLTWIEGRAADLESQTRSRSAPHEQQAEAYMHFVLALAGKGRKARISRLIEQASPAANGEAAEDLYMLKAALYLAGDRRHARDLKAVDASPIALERHNTWSFYSDRRRRAFMLSTFHDLFGNDPAGEALANRVAEGLRGSSSSAYNTQELAWGVTGLGKWSAGLGAHKTAAGTLTADGASLAPRKPPGGSADRTWTLARASQYRSLALDVPASAAGLFLVISSEGVRAGSSYKLGGTGLSVRRAYRDLAGRPVDLRGGKVQLGEVVFVEVTVGNRTGDTVQNVAVVDRVPAGFEVENARLGRDVPLAWDAPENRWEMAYQNIRDDRVESFGALGPGDSKTFVYAMRAVTSGTFAAPPVEAEAMYDPTLWARDASGPAIVGGPWTGKLL